MNILSHVIEPSKGHYTDAELAAIPESMKYVRRWLLWREVPRTGKKAAKVPVTGKDYLNSRTWLSFNEAVRQLEDQPGTRLGFILGDGWSGADADDCFEDGMLNDFAADMVRLGSYCEESPSGRGIKSIFQAGIFRNHNRKGQEIYEEGRFFAITGKRIGSAFDAIDCQDNVDWFYDKYFARYDDLAPVQILNPSPSLEHAEILTLLRAARNYVKFEKLYTGDGSGYKSRSEADFALIRLIRFFTQNEQQIEAILWTSGLQREKWRERRKVSYLQVTIREALRLGGPAYCPSRRPTVGRNDTPIPLPSFYMTLRGMGDDGREI